MKAVELGKPYVIVNPTARFRPARFGKQSRTPLWLWALVLMILVGPPAVAWFPRLPGGFWIGLRN